MIPRLLGERAGQVEFPARFQECCQLWLHLPPPAPSRQTAPHLSGPGWPPRGLLSSQGRRGWHTQDLGHLALSGTSPDLLCCHICSWGRGVLPHRGTQLRQWVSTRDWSVRRGQEKDFRKVPGRSLRFPRRLETPPAAPARLLPASRGLCTHTPRSGRAGPRSCLKALPARWGAAPEGGQQLQGQCPCSC